MSTPNVKFLLNYFIRCHRALLFIIRRALDTPNDDYYHYYDDYYYHRDDYYYHYDDVCRIYVILCVCRGVHFQNAVFDVVILIYNNNTLYRAQRYIDPFGRFCRRRYRFSKNYESSCRYHFFEPRAKQNTTSHILFCKCRS